jgi:predicted metalloprotease with PDZ domain
MQWSAIFCRAVCFALVCFAIEPMRAHAQEADGKKSDPIVLEVDASEAPRRILHARLVLPVAPGPLTLLFPKWIPGTHGPTGPISDLAGLKLSAAGKAVPWQRDEVDMYAFHCRVPPDARTLEIRLDVATEGRRGGGTPQIATIRWNQMLLYPKGTQEQETVFQASLRVPVGWKIGTALPIDAQESSTTRFRSVPLETLVDSPVICGQYFQEVPLGNYDGLPHFLELACDSPAGLEVPDDAKAQHQKLVAEAGALFGARHYRSYRFLVALSGQAGFGGLEHHESSDNGGPERMMVDKPTRNPLAFLLPHEYVHSWNGKYRRPADLITPDFQQPQRTKLLWVYEGLTEYLGTILTARCGLWTPEETRDYIALTAEKMQTQRGRAWRPLEDTAVGAPLNVFGSPG